MFPRTGALQPMAFNSEATALLVLFLFCALEHLWAAQAEEQLTIVGPMSSTQVLGMWTPVSGSVQRQYLSARIENQYVAVHAWIPAATYSTTTGLALDYSVSESAGRIMDI